MGFYGEIHVFFKAAVYASLEHPEPISTLKNLIAGSIPFKYYVNSHRETMC
jgi:hypothetical protein